MFSIKYTVSSKFLTKAFKLFICTVYIITCNKNVHDIVNSNYFSNYRLEQWIVNSGREDFRDLPLDKLRRKFVCDLHFQTQDMLYNSGNARLLRTAIPRPLNPQPDGATQDNSMLLSRPGDVPVAQTSSRQSGMAIDISELVSVELSCFEDR